MSKMVKLVRRSKGQGASTSTGASPGASWVCTQCMRAQEGPKEYGCSNPHCPASRVYRPADADFDPLLDEPLGLVSSELDGDFDPTCSLASPESPATPPPRRGRGRPKGSGKPASARTPRDDGSARSKVIALSLPEALLARIDADAQLAGDTPRWRVIQALYNERDARATRPSS